MTRPLPRRTRRKQKPDIPTQQYLIFYAPQPQPKPTPPPPPPPPNKKEP